LVLVDASGNYVTAESLRTYSNLKSFLQNQNAANMANVLSIQLLTAELNVLLGRVNAETSIFVPATNLSAAQQASLQTNGVSNPSGIANIQDILDASIAELLAHPQTPTGSQFRLFQDALKSSLDAINHNEAIFILV
jgi:hypothetical protein